MIRFRSVALAALLLCGMSLVGFVLFGLAACGGEAKDDDANAADGADGNEVLSFEVSVVAEGLINPVGLAALPTGGLLVAEEGTGENDDSAAIAMITPGRVDRILTGLPSGRDSGDLSGVPMVGLSPDGTTVYTAHFGSEALLTFPLPSRKAVDSGFVFGLDDLERTMEPLNRVRLTNPFDIAFSPEGSPVVSDASENGVAMELAGQTKFIHRFGELQDPNDDAMQVDAVPTGITRVGDEYLVTLTGGCPYPDGVGRVVAVDGTRSERVVVDGLNMPIDVTTGSDGTLWVLEFGTFEPGASCFSGEGYMAETGRLSKIVDGELVPVLDNLDFPGAVVAGEDGSLYVTEIFAGRVLQLHPEGLDGAAAGPGEPASPWVFADIAAEVGLDFEHGAFANDLSADPVAMMGGGLCWIDADGDSDVDLYLVNSHAEAEAADWVAGEGLPANALFRNDGGSDGFTDVSDGSGADIALRGNGCVAADLDNDGDTDLYVTADGPNALLINDGTGSFTEGAVEAGVATEGWSTTAVVGDVDGDGNLDLFVGSYIDFERKIDKPSGAFPQDYVGIANHLYMNNGDGTFTDMAADAGVAADDRTLGALFTDLDADGDLDLYVANDGQPNALYENVSASQGAQFNDVTRSAGVSDSGSGMGVAGGDYDGDGNLDLMITNWEAELNAIYRSNGPGLEFVYSTSRIGYAGFGAGTTGWGTAWADLDHDTDLDLVIANGRVPVTDLSTDPELVEIYGSLTAEGEPGQLRDWTQRTGLADVGPRLSRGSALADFDNDGDLDIAINQIAGPVVLLKNTSPSGAYLVVEADPALPGTHVEVELDNGVVLQREIYAGSSYLSSEDHRLHFGLGIHGVTSVQVTWPDGTSTTVREVEPNSTIQVAPDA